MRPLHENIAIATAAATIVAIGAAGTTFGQSPAQKRPASNQNSSAAPSTPVTTAAVEKATPETFVDAQNLAFGKQTTQRATHAKGIVAVGRFQPTAQAANVSRAPHFKQAVSITVRFSNNTGLPKLADAAPQASPHGLAIKFHLPDGTETDLVTHSFNGFPVRTADDMRQLFLAVGRSGSGVASPTPIEQFLAAHPTAKTFLTTQDPPPVGYGTLNYFGVNSFKFTNAQGSSKLGRYQLVAEDGRQFLSKEAAAKASPDYLEDELRSRLSRGNLRFKILLQLAAPGDAVDDPSIAWSNDNERITLGVLSVTALVPDSATTDRGLLFLPGVLPVGIEPADPMIQFRNKTYPVSYERRQNP